MPRSQQWFIAILCLGLYCYLGTQIQQKDFFLYFSTYSALFGLYLLLFKKLDTLNYGFWVSISILIRFIFVFTLPQLSDDYYRFFWDAGIFHQGISPYALKPSEIELTQLNKALQNIYPYLNSPDYYSVYPPLLQEIFRAAYRLSDGSLYGFSIAMKSFSFLAEAVTISLLYLFGKSQNQSRSWSLLYVLNPFIIIELMGNMHPEVFITPLMILSLSALLQNNWKWGIAWTGAIALKINPLLYAPLLTFQKFRIERLWVFIGAISLALASFYEVWAYGLFNNFFESLRLYYQTFEFNGSLYLLFRAMGYWVYGYNAIHLIGPPLFIAASIIIVGISLWAAMNQKLNDIRGLSRIMSFLWLIYLLFSSIVHPWYISIMIPLGIISGLRFPMVWSYVIGLSYLHYSFENGLPYWISIIQYGLLLIFLIMDIKKPALKI